jgi:hypothetical protein
LSYFFGSATVLAEGLALRKDAEPFVFAAPLAADTLYTALESEVQVKVSIQFQYTSDEKRRPDDCADHNDPIEAKDGEQFAIPDVGDTVSYDSYEYDYKPGGELIEASGRVVRVARKVKTRHFSYYPDAVYINIVVTDVPQSEMALRLKE